jgi:hypothetical protein
LITRQPSRDVAATLTILPSSSGVLGNTEISGGNITERNAGDDRASASAQVLDLLNIGVVREIGGAARLADAGIASQSSSTSVFLRRAGGGLSLWNLKPPVSLPSESTQRVAARGSSSPV